MGTRYPIPYTKEWGEEFLGFRMVFDHIDEFVEKITAIPWTRRIFGVVLDGKYGQLLMPQSFDRIVIQIQMSDFQTGG